MQWGFMYGVEDTPYSLLVSSGELGRFEYLLCASCT